MHGIDCIEVNGSKSVNSRATYLDKFRTSTRDDKRVCLLSQVGTEGLNISEANILIILVHFFLRAQLLRVADSLLRSIQDTMWSRQEDTQLIGRVWRLPQDKNVIVYRLMMKDSTDILLNVISFTKMQLLQAFTSASGKTST